MMKTYVAVLRGINVSGKKMIRMPELQKMMEAIHFEQVRTYIQSGNIVFVAGEESYQALQNRLQKAIEETFSFDVPVIILSAPELLHIQQNNPFLEERKEDMEQLHVTFLDETPDQELVETLKVTAQFLPDEWFVSGKTIYVFCPGGYGKTRLNNNFFEKKLKVTATTRNWKTVNKLVEMATTEY